MSDKLFVLRVEEYNGEQEYSEDIFIIAPDRKMAEDWARENVKTRYDDECTIFDENGEEDSLWWTYESFLGSPAWRAISLEEEYELMHVNHTKGCENSNSHVKLVIE